MGKSLALEVEGGRDIQSHPGASITVNRGVNHHSDKLGRGYGLLIRFGSISIQAQSISADTDPEQRFFTIFWSTHFPSTRKTAQVGFDRATE
jgi:hypothetical protein